jgi:hypothetical protein
MSPRTCPTTSRTRRGSGAGAPDGDGDALDEAVADGVAVDDDVAVPDDELETVALLLARQQLELEADALPDKVGVVDQLEDVDPVDVELGVAVLDAVAGRRRRR